MTKAELIVEIANKAGIERAAVQVVVESFMESIRQSLLRQESVYLRGFGSFIIKERAKKLGRNITKGTSVMIPARKVPVFKPAKSFVTIVKAKVK